MAKAEWGTKRICQECGTKFYDMRRAEIICPKCETVFEVAAPKPRRAPAPAKPPEPPKAAVAAKAKDAETAEDDVALDELGGDDVEDDEDDEDIIEDTTDLGDDDDDMAEVIQKPGASEES